jgi:hypothetical protein
MNIDKAFVISVKEADERRKQFAEYNNLQVEYFLVDRKPDPTKGNFESHYAVINTAKKRQYKTILVFEDDAVPLEETKKIVKYVNTFLLNAPKDWKILTLGYLPIKLQSTENESLYDVKCAYDAHAYLVNVQNVDIQQWKGKALDSNLFCHDIDPKELLFSIFFKKMKGVYAHYPMLYKQKSTKSYIAGIDLYQDYFFKIFGYNTSAKLSSYVNIIYFSITIILILFILIVLLSIYLYKK